MKKICPCILLFWPYLFFPAVYLDSLNPDGGLVCLAVYCILTPILYLANIICACRGKDVRSLTRWNMALKLVHIPSYLIVFTIGLASAVAMIKLPFTVLLIPVLAVIDFLLLISTSAYGVKALYIAGKQGLITKEFTIAHILLQFVFVLDVVSAVITFIKIRKSPASS